MVKTLSRCARFALVLAVAVGSIGSIGCAVAPEDESVANEDELVRSAHAALSTSNPTGVAPLQIRATYDPALGKTMVDLTSNAFPQAPTDPDPHDDDRFLAVLVYVDRTDGRRDLVRVLTQKDYYGPNGIGPGGGCIHFNVPAAIGDRLFVGGIVKLEGETRARLAAAPLVTVTQGQWQFGEELEHEH